MFGTHIPELCRFMRSNDDYHARTLICAELFQPGLLASGLRVGVKDAGHHRLALLGLVRLEKQLVRHVLGSVTSRPLENYD